LKALDKYKATENNIGGRYEHSLALRLALKISVHLPALKGKDKNFILEQATKAQRGSKV
jgi:hypothetical protein